MDIIKFPVVTRLSVGSAMTLHVVAKALRMDKLAISLRLGERNFDSLNIINDLLRLYLEHGEAVRISSRRYRNTRFQSSVFLIPLSHRPTRSSLRLVVETGCATDWHGKYQPYAKFEFNVQRLADDQDAKQRFQHVMLDLIPSGGYPVLLDDGYVLYTELSADFRGVRVESLDTFCPKMDESLYFYRDGALKTICLHDNKPGRIEAFCIYDKKLSDREQRCRVRRGDLLRIEARRRFNRSPRYRTLKLHQLPTIANPFSDLRLYSRERIDETFTAARHERFISEVRSSGVQHALAGTRGADRERRIRMLDTCRVDWWNPDDAWRDICNATTEALLRQP